jgi:16S rRNA (uracil1498-N3)-methyltransferase
LKPDNQIGNQKRDRWQRIAEEAAELSMRAYVPEINNPTTLTSWCEHLANVPSPILKYICVISPPVTHLLTSLTSSSSSLDFSENNGQIIIATGCEGGWTTREEEMAIASGFVPVSLGDRVLSAVTAPVVALSIVSAFSDCR